MSPSPDVVKTHTIEATSSAEPTTEASDPAFQLSWHRDEEHDSNKEADFELGGIEKTLVTEPTQPSNSGPYYNATTDVVTQLIKNEGDFFSLFILSNQTFLFKFLSNINIISVYKMTKTEVIHPMLVCSVISNKST